MWNVSMRYNKNASYKLHITWAYPAPPPPLLPLLSPLPAPFYDRRQPNLINPNSRKLPLVFPSFSLPRLSARFSWHFHSSFYGRVWFFWHLATPSLIEPLAVSHQKVPFYNVDFRALERQIQMYLYLYVALSSFDTHNRAIDFTSQTLNLTDR